MRLGLKLPVTGKSDTYHFLSWLPRRW